MIPTLYEPFRHWSDGGSVYILSDLHFDLLELMDCYDNDILFLFKALLNEQSGANIRNEIAHGIIGEASASSGIYLYFMVAVIKLLTYTSVSCYEILTKSEKLKELVIPDEDKIRIEGDESP